MSGPNKGPDDMWFGGVRGPTTGENGGALLQLLLLSQPRWCSYRSRVEVGGHGACRFCVDLIPIPPDLIRIPPAPSVTGGLATSFAMWQEKNKWLRAPSTGP